MTHSAIAVQWVTSIRRAAQLGDAEAAYRLTLGLVRRMRELGHWQIGR